MLDVFYEFLYDIFERYIPKSYITSSKKPKWHSKQLSHLKNVRNREYKKMCLNKLKSQNANNKFFFDAKEAFEKLKNDLYNEYVSEMAQSANENPKNFWNFINEKRKQKSLPTQMKSNTKKILMRKTMLLLRIEMTMVISASSSHLNVF